MKKKMPALFTYTLHNPWPRNEYAQIKEKKEKEEKTQYPQRI